MIILGKNGNNLIFEHIKHIKQIEQVQTNKLKLFQNGNNLFPLINIIFHQIIPLYIYEKN